MIKKIEDRYFKECNVVMLPTKDFTKIIKVLSTGEVRLYQNDDHEYSSFKCVIKSNLQHQHLYITSDDEIKEGDWFYDSEKGKIHQCNHVFTNAVSAVSNNVTRYTHYVDTRILFKIIATTDKSLNITKQTSYRLGKSAALDVEYLPQPSQSFIKAFVKAGSIKEVLVEYEKGGCTHNSCYTPECKDLCYTIRTGSHNTITIKEAKEKMYSREEVKELCMLAHNNGWKANTAFTTKKGQSPKYTISHWIKENL